MTENVFGPAAAWYDALYHERDYAHDAAVLHECIQTFSPVPARTLLDVACGTGLHLSLLRHEYDVAGVDIDPAMLEVAQGRCPNVPFFPGDMRTFHLNRQFDVLTCLARSTGAAETNEYLCQTMHNFAVHVVPDGLVIIEPWLMEDLQALLDKPSMLTVDLPDLKIARLHVPYIMNDRVVLHYHYLVATSAGVQRYEHQHELGVFTYADYKDACDRAALEIIDDTHQVHNQRLLIAKRRQH